MDVPRTDTRSRRNRRFAMIGAGGMALGLLAFGATRLEPPAPGVERERFLIDSVRRGEVVTGLAVGDPVILSDLSRWENVDRLKVRDRSRVSLSWSPLERPGAMLGGRRRRPGVGRRREPPHRSDPSPVR